MNTEINFFGLHQTITIWNTGNGINIRVETDKPDGQGDRVKKVETVYIHADCEKPFLLAIQKLLY